jgi:hypothetical protein
MTKLNSKKTLLNFGFTKTKPSDKVNTSEDQNNEGKPESKGTYNRSICLDYGWANTQK